MQTRGLTGNRVFLKKAGCIFLILCLAFVVGGWRVGGGEAESGNPIDKKKVKEIKPGMSSADIIGLFGAPTSQTSVGPNDILIWEHCKTKSGGAGAFGVGGSKSKRSCNKLTVTMDRKTDKVVSHKWDKQF